MSETIKGIQDAGVIACAKHYIMNEQEHDRDTYSANLDDKTMHELYLWVRAASIDNPIIITSADRFQAIRRFCPCWSWFDHVFLQSGMYIERQ